MIRRAWGLGQRGVGRGRRGLIALSLLAAVAEPAAFAQVTNPRDTTHAQHQAPFFTKKDAWLAAGFVAATVIMFPVDKHAAERLQDPGTQAKFVRHVWRIWKKWPAPNERVGRYRR